MTLYEAIQIGLSVLWFLFLYGFAKGVRSWFVAALKAYVAANGLTMDRDL